MQKLSELYTLDAVDDLIDEICRNMPPGFRRIVDSGTWSPEERARDMKIDAVCKALERRAQLEEEIRSGFRDPSGVLNIRV